jgi:hypothetical protein
VPSGSLAFIFVLLVSRSLIQAEPKARAARWSTPRPLVLREQPREREFRARKPVIGRLARHSLLAMIEPTSPTPTSRPVDSETISFAGLLTTLALTNTAIVWFALNYFG